MKVKNLLNLEKYSGMFSAYFDSTSGITLNNLPLLD
jgi:hypothetical protein